MKKTGSKGQGASEFLIILALFLTILASFTIPSMVRPAFDSSSRVRKISEARTAGDQIASSINNIAWQGDNSRDTISVDISSQWALDMDSDTVRVLVYGDGGTREVGNSIDYGFVDNIDKSSGYYRIIIEKVDAGEGITKSEDDHTIRIRLNPG